MEALQYTWSDVTVRHNGETVNKDNFVALCAKDKRCKYPGMLLYHRRGNKHFFINKKGLKIVIKSDDFLFRMLQYGQVVGLEF